ncbi:hypothetical protein [Hirschia maritima]|uniref:hypothetical protein n=1 Tax=Hirschia maritima TaxID=1121961 RepID=UPI00037799F6|nr:hypothetical protein [Hirschia maritima]
MFIEALITLIHVLIFVYWLGGDLGAFYTSRFLINTETETSHQMMALKVVNDVDMAPRTALILALPTGLSLAFIKSWIQIPFVLLIAIIAFSLVWLVIAWKLHLSHGKASNNLKNLDFAIRYGAITLLTIISILGLVGKTETPLFLNLKMLILAGCISLGLYIRVVLKPLGSAIAQLNGPNNSSAKSAIADTLNKARPLVLGIWALLLSAAILGLWLPTNF